MNILYVVTVLAIYVLFMLIHKTEKKQNLIAWLAISVVAMVCYNTLICVICTFIGFKCTLLNLSICNILAIIALTIILIKNKKIQKYYIKVFDVVVTLLILLIVIFVAYKQYGFPFKLRYIVTDGSSHYFYAQQFYENETLLYNESTDDTLNLYRGSFRLPGAYVNEGILFRVFDGIVVKVDLFVIFDLAVLFLSGILFYYLLKTYAKDNKVLNILAVIFSIMHMLAYQLNSILYGYVYLTLALDIILAFLVVFTNYRKEGISSDIALPILSLISFGMFFTYAYFIPIIYLTIIIDTIIKSKKANQKIMSEDNMILLGYLILVPLILGATYFIIMPIVKGMKTEISTIGDAGDIYENYITNYLAFIPIFIMWGVISRKSKNKEITSPTILFILSIIFAIILLIGYKLKIVSAYYYFKAYYIIWPLTICNVFIALRDILSEGQKKIKIGTYVYISIYAITIIVSTLIMQKNIGINDIFHYNTKEILREWYQIKSEEAKRSEIIENKLKSIDTYICVPKEPSRMLWISILHHDQQVYWDSTSGPARTIDRWVSERGEKYYVAYHHDYKKIEEEDYINEDSEKYKVLYNDEYVFVLEKK